MAFQRETIKGVVNVALSLALSCLVSIGSNPTHSWASGHKVLVQKQAVVVKEYVPIVVARVGEHLENEALIDKRVEEKLTELGFTPNQQPPNQTGKLSPRSLLNVHCARCHQGQNKKATEYWDMRKGITPDQGWLITGMVTGKIKPPASMQTVINQIKKEEKGTLLDELFALSSQSNTPKEEVVESVPEEDTTQHYGGF